MKGYWIVHYEQMQTYFYLIWKILYSQQNTKILLEKILFVIWKAVLLKIDRCFLESMTVKAESFCTISQPWPCQVLMVLSIQRQKPVKTYIFLTNFWKLLNMSRVLKLGLSKLSL